MTDISATTEFDPQADMGPVEIPQCSDLQAHRGVLSSRLEAQEGSRQRSPPRFRTIQV
jgi:hypothetical protein